MALHDELALLLRPAGGGVPLVSAGLEDQRALERRLAGVHTDAEVLGRWREDLARAGKARAGRLGRPSDVGAGHRRGASFGPSAVRERLVRDDPSFVARARAAGLVDLGDVVTVPQLLHDDMLSEEQKERTRSALYPGLGRAERALLPVSPLSLAERVTSLVVAANPDAAFVAIGGDHSAALPVVRALATARSGLGIVQLDAHTDLLEERFGVRYCFGTWSYHANDALGRSGRLVQVGLRVSRHDRGHWESTLGVRQLWASEVRADPDAALDRILALLGEARVERVYLSNDIDGTDPAFAPATGTPEEGGLDPSFVVALIRRLARELSFAGGDIMEVAPGLGGADEGDRTLAVAARYLRETIAASLGIAP
jgi:agmatinase